MNKLNSKKGFSLIELLVVIAIIGILSAVGITAYTGYTASAKEQAARTQFSQLVSLMNAEFAKCGLGSGDYAWVGTHGTTGACDATVNAAFATMVTAYVKDGLGYKNPYNQSATDHVATATLATGTSYKDGNIQITCAASGCTIKQKVKDDTVLSQNVSKAN